MMQCATDLHGVPHKDWLAKLCVLGLFCICLFVLDDGAGRPPPPTHTVGHHPSSREESSQTEVAVSG